MFSASLLDQTNSLFIFIFKRRPIHFLLLLLQSIKKFSEYKMEKIKSISIKLKNLSKQDIVEIQSKIAKVMWHII